MKLRPTQIGPGGSTDLEILVHIDAGYRAWIYRDTRLKLEA